MKIQNNNQRYFNRCNKYGVPVLRSEHPWVNQFVGEHLRSIREMAARGSVVHRVDIAIVRQAKGGPVSSEGETALNSAPIPGDQRREDIQVSGILEDTAECYAFSFDRPPAFDSSLPSTLYVIEASFRTMVLKLNSALASLPKLG